MRCFSCSASHRLASRQATLKSLTLCRMRTYMIGVPRKGWTLAVYPGPLASIPRKMKPVFVIGYPRSGTTLLLHLLMGSGEFPTYKFSESHFYSHCYRRYGSLSRPRNRERLLDELENREWFSGSEVSRADLESAVAGNATNYSAYLASFMDLVANRQSKTRWIEKTPWHMLYVPEIRTAFPSAKFLVLVRDPRDVVLSIANYGWTGKSVANLVRTAIAWQWHMRLLARLFDESDDGLFLRYEDIVESPSSALDRINGFLDLKLSMTPQESVGSGFGVLRASNSSYGAAEGGIHSRSLGRWREKMPSMAKSQIQWLLDGELARFRYERDAAGSPAAGTRIKLKLARTAYRTMKALKHAAFPVVRR